MPPSPRDPQEAGRRPPALLRAGPLLHRRERGGEKSLPDLAGVENYMSEFGPVGAGDRPGLGGRRELEPCLGSSGPSNEPRSGVGVVPALR